MISTIPLSVYSKKVTWSPCGQFVATVTKETVEMRNGLTLELMSTLHPASKFRSFVAAPPSYQPDGHSLACATDTGIVIWDIQTGGVVKEIQCDTKRCRLLVWSLDGGLVGALFDQEVQVHNVSSNMASTHIELGFAHHDNFWAHNGSLQIMRILKDEKCCTIDIFEIGPPLTKVESFSILESEGVRCIWSFSPTTYRVSGRFGEKNMLFILNIQKSEWVLTAKGDFRSHSFSSDGSCFAAFQSASIHIWKYNNNHYIPWKQFHCTFGCDSIVFSPTSSSIAVPHAYLLQLLHLNYSPTASINTQHLKIFSHSGTHIATANYRGSIITITSLAPQTHSQFIETGIKITGLGLTTNVLLVRAVGGVMAWLLTEEGWVSNIPDNRNANHSDSIWTFPLPHGSQAKFLVEGGTGAVRDGKTLFVYNAITGEVIEPTQEPTPFHGPWYTFKDHLQAKDHHNDSSQDSTPSTNKQKPTQTNLKEGWMKDHEGKCLLWLPTEWRVKKNKVRWFSDTSTIKFNSELDKPIIIKLQ